MNRRNRTLLVIGLAVLLAALASFGAYRAIQQIPVREVEVAKAHFVVAARPLPVGTMVVKEDVKLEGWPSDAPVLGGFSTIEEVVNRGLTDSLAQGEPLTTAKLAPKDGGAGLPPTSPAGMRAMSVKVNEVIGVAGFLVRGTHVDLIVVIRPDQQRDSISRVVVTNVQVLAAGTNIDQEAARSGKPIQSSVVTLLVTPADAEKIALAQNQGQIMLALRNPLDTEIVDTPGVRTGALIGAPAPPPVRQVRPSGQVRVVAPPPPPPPPKPYTVEVIRGAKRSDEVVK
jgi:pilus assembly protein CpaB